MEHGPQPLGGVGGRCQPAAVPGLLPGTRVDRMPTYKTSRPCALALVALALAAGAVCAHVVIFKHGFVLQGTVKEDQEVIVARTEHGHRAFVIPQGNFFLDDNARLVTFARNRVADVSE